MPRIPFPGFIGETYRSQSVFVGVEELINLYPEKTPLQGTTKSQIYYYHMPAARVYCSLPHAVYYAMIAASPPSANGLWKRYVLAGDVGSLPHLYEIDDTGGGSPTGTGTDLGQLPGTGTMTIVPDTFQMKWNGTQLYIIGFAANIGVPAGPNTAGGLNYAASWCYTWQTNVLAVVPVAFTQMQPTSLSYIDGYMVVTNGSFNFSGSTGSANRISTSNYLDCTTWNPLSTGQIADETDTIVAVAADHQQVFIFGTKSTRCWYDAGNYPFPLGPIQGAQMNVGCAAVRSIAQVETGLFWLGVNASGTAIAYRNVGYQEHRISTNAVEWAWQQYGAVFDAVGYGLQMLGHTWYVLTFPGGNATWVYDLGTEMWFQWGYWDGVKLNASLGRYHLFDPLLSQHLVAGGDISGNIYLLDPNSYLDNGNPILRQRTAPHLSEEMLQVFYQEFQMDAQIGDGNWAYQLSWSNDGGNTFNTPITISGPIGNFLARIRAVRLGLARNRVFRVTTTDALPQAWVGAWLDLEAATT